MKTLVGVLLLGLVGLPEPGRGPSAVVVATSRGVATIPIDSARGYPALPSPALERMLPMSTGTADGPWVEVKFAEQPFRFLVDAPVLVFQNRVLPLVGGAYVARDTVFVPLQWLAEYLPQTFGEAYRYDPLGARFEETRLAPVAADPPQVVPRVNPDADVPPAARRIGLREKHKVVIDPGHGGRDPGTPGRYLPRGVQEKHVTLAISKIIQRELESRGVEVVLTRGRDVKPSYRGRAALCQQDCDLFVSVHVNALTRTSARGVETYFFDDATTLHAARVAEMENEALRFEDDVPPDEADPLNFIFKDLHQNEYLRESADAADQIQRSAGSAHPGGGRFVGQANFAVLRYATRSVVLIETGYATNWYDVRFLASDNKQQQLARTIANGIIEYLLRYENKTILSTFN